VDRPKTWSADEALTISSSKYDLKRVHSYIKRCVKGTSSDVKVVKIRRGFREKTGNLGLSAFDEKTIYLEALEDERELYITLLHEVFHYFFHDEKQYQDSEEIDEHVENRAEISAINMYNWYMENPKKFREVKKIFEKLKTKKITIKEKEEL
jgi:Zn-dependent peptidase ImmA (M78 family)